MNVLISRELLRRLRDYTAAYHENLRSIRSSEPMVAMHEAIKQADAILSTEPGNVIAE